MHHLLFAFSTNPSGQQGGPSIFMSLIPILFIFLIFYLLLILPQQKKQKQHVQMISALRKGDRIVTSAGIYGTVSDVKDDRLVVSIADEVKIEILKSAVAAIIERKDR